MRTLARSPRSRPWSTCLGKFALAAIVLAYPIVGSAGEPVEKLTAAVANIPILTDALDRLKATPEDRRADALRRAGELIDEVDSLIQQLEQDIGISDARQEIWNDIEASRKILEISFEAMRKGSARAWRDDLIAFSEAYREILAGWERSVKDLNVKTGEDIPTEGEAGESRESARASGFGCGVGLEAIVLVGTESAICVVPVTASSLVARGRATRP